MVGHITTECAPIHRRTDPLAAARAPRRRQRNCHQLTPTQKDVLKPVNCLSIRRTSSQPGRFNNRAEQAYVTPPTNTRITIEDRFVESSPASIRVAATTQYMIRLANAEGRNDFTMSSFRKPSAGIDLTVSCKNARGAPTSHAYDNPASPHSTPTKNAETINIQVQIAFLRPTSARPTP